MKKQLIGFAYFVIMPVLLFTLLLSCTHDPETYEGIEPVCYDTQVLPILQTSCGMTGCHDGTEDDFILTDHNSVMKSVRPGDPRGSKLYQVLTDIHSEEMMPPDIPLTKLQRNIIQVWIAQGANEIICAIDTGGNPVKEVCFVQDILPMMLSSCGTTGCHDAVTQEHGHAFTDYSNILIEIEPFVPESSEIYKAVTETGGDRMPPAPLPAFTATQIAALREWIEKGALNSDCPENVCDTAGIISFSTQVNPILQKNCVGCHNASLSNGNVNLSGYTQVLIPVQNLRNGTPVLLGSIKRMTGFVAMPLTFGIDQCSSDIIEKWIAQGAENN